MAHTPEPWTIDADGWSDAADLIENHPRIVSAVNACRGLPTESLTDGVVVRLANVVADFAEYIQWNETTNGHALSPNYGPTVGVLERLHFVLAELSKETKPMSDKQAFPMTASGGTHRQFGLTLREWFAGMAMQSLIAKIPLHDRQGEYGVHAPALEDIHKVREDVAQSACDYADALLAELSKPEET